MGTRAEPARVTLGDLEPDRAVLTHPGSDAIRINREQHG